MPAAARRCGGAVVSRFREDDLPGVASRHAGEGVEERRLAGAVSAQERERLALRQHQVDPCTTTASP
jgi:hypothetical protein